MRLSAFLVRRRAAIAAAWAIGAALLLPQARHAGEVLEPSARLEASESAAVDRLLNGPLASAYARFALLVVNGLPALDTPAGAEALRKVVEPLKRAPEVQATFSYLDTSDTLFQHQGSRSTFAVVGLVSDSTSPEVLIQRLRLRTSGLAGELIRVYPDLTLRWTGTTALNVDLRQASSHDVNRAERRALPVTAALLLLAFGTLAAALLPVVAGALAISVALGAAVMIARVISLSILLQSVVSMLGLGLGIDYALLMVSRFREALARGLDPAAAAEEASRHAGHTILLSAATVALGFLVLLTVPLNEMRAVAAGGLLVVVTSSLLATTLLPGALAQLGHRLDWGRVRPARPGQPSAERWRRLGRWVTARPWSALVLGAVPLLLLAAQALRLRTGLPKGDWLPASMESAQALDDLRRLGRAGVIQNVRVVLELPAGVSARRSQGWAGVAKLVATLEADHRIVRVRSIVGVAHEAGMGRTALALLSPDVTRGLVSEDGRQVLLELIPQDSLSPGEIVALVRELRATGATPVGVAGARIMVGGLPAFNADYQDAVAGRFREVVALVIGGTLIALFLGFRSILIPLKAMVLNLLSVAAAFGALTLVFQEGHGARLFGVAAPLGEVFSSLPLMVFCIVFGLSMDYEVFLMTRVMEARRAGCSDRDAIVEALGSTGSMITSAASIMLAVFAAFTLGDFLLTKMLGFALAVAVLLDATVVRMVIGPALLRLAGRWNWWPGGGAWDTRVSVSAPPFLPAKGGVGG